MNKVWLIEWGEFDEHGLRGCFSSLANAKRGLAKVKRQIRDRIRGYQMDMQAKVYQYKRERMAYSIEEYNLDEVV